MTEDTSTVNKSSSQQSGSERLSVRAANKLGIAPGKFFLAFFGIVMLLVLAIAIYFICFSNTPLHTAENYAKAILSGNLQEANSYSISDLHENNSKLIKQYTNPENDADHYNRIDFINNTVMLEDGYEVIDGNTAIVYNANYQEIAKLKMVNGEWKCVSFAE